MKSKTIEIYDDFINRQEKFYDIESCKTQIMLTESELLYNLDSKKLQTYGKLKKEIEEYIKLQSLKLIEFIWLNSNQN